jgi:hypothetical protein
MQWSQVKKRIEESLAKSVRGRVEFWMTRYRHSHDKVGEAWITIDKVRVASMGTQTFFNEYYGTAHQLRVDRGCLDYRDPEQQECYYKAYDEADKLMVERGIFSQGEFTNALFEFLNIPLDQALSSQSALLRGLAVLDHRFGKRRVAQFDATNEHPLVTILFEFRRRAEGITTHPNPSMHSDGAARDSAGDAGRNSTTTRARPD